MTTPSSESTEVEQPTVASSRFKITKEGIESEQRVPGEHTPGLLISAVLTICTVMAVVAPALTLKVAADYMSPAWAVTTILVQEFVIAFVAIIAWVVRKR
jgi:hypothetical protein